MKGRTTMKDMWRKRGGREARKDRERTGECKKGQVRLEGTRVSKRKGRGKAQEKGQVRAEGTRVSKGKGRDKAQEKFRGKRKNEER